MTTIRVARAAGCEVYVADGAVPGGSRARDMLMRRLIRASSNPIGRMTLTDPASRLETHVQAEGADSLTDALV